VAAARSTARRCSSSWARHRLRFGLELVDQGGEAGGQAGEGGAALGPVALGQVLADADKGENSQHQQRAQQGDDELAADGEIPEHRRPTLGTAGGEGARTLSPAAIPPQ